MGGPPIIILAVFRSNMSDTGAFDQRLRGGLRPLRTRPNTMIGPTSQLLGYGFHIISFQVIPKHLSLSFIADHADVADAFAEDRLEREASYLNLVCVLEQMCDATMSKPEDWILPDIITLRAPNVDELRLPREGTCEHILFNTKDATAVIEISQAYLDYGFPVATHMTDRSSINCSLLHWAVANRMTWVPYFGEFHSLWNALKAVARKCGRFSGNTTGWMWKSLLEMLVVINQNAGPYRSGAWFTAKKEGCQRWFEQFGANSDEFFEIAHEFAKAQGVTLDSHEDYEELWKKMATLKSCCEKGPHLKLMRWMSINECWEYHKGEIWGLKAVLKMLADEVLGGSLGIDVHAGTTLGPLDDSVHQAVTSNTGTMIKAHSYINTRNVFAMEVFGALTAVQREHYSHRASQVKTVEEGLSVDWKFIRGEWKHELVDTIQHLMKEHVTITRLGLNDIDPGSRSRRFSSFEFTMRLVKERYDTQLALHNGYPCRFVLCTGSDPDIFEHERRDVQKDWKIITAYEHFARANADIGVVLGDIFWLQWPLVRLAFGINEMELASGADRGSFKRLATSMVAKFPDEKGAEDIHQFVRDEARRRRFAGLSKARIYETQLRANVPLKRGMTSSTLDDKKIVEHVVSGKRYKVAKGLFTVKQSAAPAQFRKCRCLFFVC